MGVPAQIKDLCRRYVQGSVALSATPFPVLPASSRGTPSAPFPALTQFKKEKRQKKDFLI